MLGRVCLIGETQVGKTSLLQRFTEGTLRGDQGQTVGAVFHTSETIIDGTPVPLQIWDTAGQERYRSLGPIYYRKSIAAIAVFDLTRPETLAALDTWINYFREYAEGKFVVVVGNKEDLGSDIKLDWQKTSEWAAQRNAECIWASAKTGVGVREVFDLIGKHVHSRENKAAMRRDGPEEEEAKCC
jgi:small GTP-binding protein